MAGWARAGVPVPTPGAPGLVGLDRGGKAVASVGAAGSGAAGWDVAGSGAALLVIARSGAASFGVADFACAGSGVAGFGVAGLRAANWVEVGVAGARVEAGGLTAFEVRATWRAAAGAGSVGFDGVAWGAGICTVGFFAVAVVSAGKDALTLSDDASTAVVGCVGTLWGTEPSAFGAGARRVLRGRPAAGGGLPALGGFAILGFAPLFRHINEIRDRGAILPSA